ncbi:MAG TPA: vWA domain-containing protein [Polyangiaceae bacterium]|nr:vWA domain-containing protein [Polyangiaceae bacterium]
MRSFLFVSCLALWVVTACSAGGEQQPLSNAGGAGSNTPDNPATGGSPSDPTEAGAFFDSSMNQDTSAVCTDSIDVVFVLDVSSSMGFVLDKLGNEIDGVVAEAQKLTTNSGAHPPHFGLIPFVDNHVIDLGGVEDGNAVHLDAQSLRNVFKFHRTNFTNPNRNPGDGLGGPTMQNPICEENALDALYAAAKDFPWRANASHIIILATDDTFLERPDNYGDRDNDGLTNKTDYPREGDYPARWTVPETVEALKVAKIRLFTFTSRGDAERHCGTGRRLPWEARAAGWSAPYFNHPPLPDSTDGANFDLDLVRKSTLSLSSTINDIVLNTYCNPPVY